MQVTHAAVAVVGNTAGQSVGQPVSVSGNSMFAHKFIPASPTSVAQTITSEL